MTRSIIQTPDAPAAIGTYSQAVRVGQTVYLSGQIGLDPVAMQLVEGIECVPAAITRSGCAVLPKLDGTRAQGDLLYVSTGGDDMRRLAERLAQEG